MAVKKKCIVIRGKALDKFEAFVLDREDIEIIAKYIDYSNYSPNIPAVDFVGVNINSPKKGKKIPHLWV